MAGVGRKRVLCAEGRLYVLVRIEVEERRAETKSWITKEEVEEDLACDQIGDRAGHEAPQSSQLVFATVERTQSWGRGGGRQWEGGLSDF